MQQIINQNISAIEKTILVVIDPRVDTPDRLAKGVTNSTAVLLLDPKRDSIIQITTALTQGNYHSLHLVAHGSPGCLHLGATDLSSETITQYQQQLLEWGIAEILVYGCQVAAKPEFLRQLHDLTVASIAASTEEVGQDNWNLEWQIGEVTSGLAFIEELRQEYQGTFIGFNPQVTFAVGNYPQGVAIADLDGDGDVDDLVVANRGDNTVSVLLGDGNGNFSPQTTFATGNSPFSVVIGDLDGDGDANDLAVSNLVVSDSNYTVSVLLGDGSGNFSPQTTFATGNRPLSVVIGDLDGDGDADDLAVATANGSGGYGSYSSNGISVLLGDGSGSFSTPTTFAAGTVPVVVAIGDLDGDGDADDLAVSDFLNDAVSVLLGDGSGGFSVPSTFTVVTNPISVAIGDLDEDGDADDIAVRDSSAVSILLGDGSGGFSPQTTFALGFGAGSVAIGDLDGDGAADDLASPNNNDDNVSILLGDDSGGFSPQTTFAAGNSPFFIAIGDLDGDGAADDLAVPNRDDNTISVLIECFLVC